jgi:hypothetical protein
MRPPLLASVATLLSCVTLLAAEPPKRPSAEEMKAAALKMAVDVTSTKDGSPQKVVYYQPDSAAKNLAGPAVPLLVFLHSWSGSIEQAPSLVGLAKHRGWVMIAPAFRGPNNRPEACASDLASQDIIDAVKARADQMLQSDDGGRNQTVLLNLQFWRFSKGRGKMNMAHSLAFMKELEKYSAHRTPYASRVFATLFKDDRTSMPERNWEEGIRRLGSSLQIPISMIFSTLR